MKTTRFIILAAVMVTGLFSIACFGLSFEGENQATINKSTTATAAVLPVSVLLSNKQVEPYQQVNAFERAGMVLLVNKAWAKEHVGKLVLNILQTDIPAVIPLDGYSNALYKPNDNYFSGIGGNHYARADV